VPKSVSTVENVSPRILASALAATTEKIANSVRNTPFSPPAGI